MSADPILVLQMQRMGDLILTFPLLLALKKRWPEHPVWVVAEPVFFEQLMPLAPEVVFFPPGHCDNLPAVPYFMAINVSSRPEAARCMAALQAERKLGPMALPDGLHVEGFWHLYRAALTQNNRYNTFHWSDLYRLDLERTAQPGQMGFTLPSPAGTGRVALVLGASEASKRPQLHFWSKLARALAQGGLMPIFLGGPAEQELGAEVARLAQLPQANLCGALPLRDVAAVLKTVDLCITPDTGPMHLANWLGVPVLDLSMGPVHAWETGPTAPGQYVLQSALPCTGCWQCRRHPRYACRDDFDPAQVAELVQALVAQEEKTLTRACTALTRLTLHSTARDAQGLYHLEARHIPEQESLLPHIHRAVEHFWHAAYLYLYDAASQPAAQEAWQALCARFPHVGQRLAQGLVRLCAQSSAGLKKQGQALSLAFWQQQAPLVRGFAGFTHMGLQNCNFSTAGWQQALQQLTTLCQLCRF